MKLLKQLFRWIFGKSLENDRISEEKYNVFWGMPILASDAISSVAYAVEEMLWVLIPFVGMASFLWMPRIAIAIIALLLILTFSYRHVVEAYPNGGGAYVVAKENLGPAYSLIAGASLSVGYVLTVAVSICAGTTALISAVPALLPYRVPIAVLFVILLVIGNVRGVRESAHIFSIPTYAFILAVISLVIVGLVRYATGNTLPVPLAPMQEISFGTHPVTLFILLAAFSSGCSALTGVEAISNAVPNFRDPAPHNAKLTYLLLAAAIVVCFGGVASLAKIYHATPNPELTVMAQISLAVFGKGIMFYIIQVTTTIILAMAANTAFAGFPTLLSIIAQDGYAPRQMALRGHRLNYTNGITFLALLAILLIIVFEADTHLLIALYAIGVFVAFTLSQTGMLVHWFRLRNEGWQYKALVNGLGALTTLGAVIIVGVTKFTSGAWIVIVVVPLIVMLMYKIKQHYLLVAQQLDIPNDTLSLIDFNNPHRHHVIIPIDSINGMVIKALLYARSMTNDVEAFHVEPYEGEADKLKRKWAMLNTEIPLIIRESPYRDVVGQLTEYIGSEEHASRPGDLITVLLPQFFVSKWYQALLHNNTSLFIANAMLNKHNVVVSILPFYLAAYNVKKYQKVDDIKDSQEE
ncbi:MAG TPA: amino acid permease [Syntrophomonas sp.]|jgi:amino acid transporter|nr:amino acid permease [Syntrophomonas sp.]HCF70719.1 amino acid permease [Syntrophomonas sp.]